MASKALALGSTIRTMSVNRPVRVLHIADTLGSGGVERLILDIVRLSDPKRVRHRVITFFPDGFHGPFVYAERLRKLNAYGRPTNGAPIETVAGSVGLAHPEIPAATAQSDPSRFADLGSVFSGVRKPLGAVVPEGLKPSVVSAWNSLVWRMRSASSTWRGIWGGLRWKASMYGLPTFLILQEFFRFRPDVIHAHGFYGFPYGLMFKRVFRRPMVHSVPCLISQMIHEVGCPWMPGLYERHNKFVSRIFINAGYRDELLGLGVPAKKLVDIKGLLDLEAITETKSARAQHRVEVRTRLGIPQDALLALSVGRLNPVKGHQYEIEAMPAILKRFPNLHLVILGEGHDRTELEAAAERLGVGQNVHLIGFIEDPLPFYAAADIYFRSAIFEGENLSSYPAIALGLPVVGFDTSCATDLISKLGHGVLVANKDAAAFAEGVISILTLPDRGRSMGQRGVDYCYQHLGVVEDVENLMSIYATLHQHKGRDS
jgi:glycosyltransferase involved in cell wall biosynthesis